MTAKASDKSRVRRQSLGKHPFDSGIHFKTGGCRPQKAWQGARFGIFRGHENFWPPLHLLHYLLTIVTRA